MAKDFDPAELDALIARVDPERHMAARFAPAPDRPRLTGLYAFNYEIARVRERVSEPALGDIRLAWWREAVDEIYDPKRQVRWHEAARALDAAFAGRPPPRLWIDRMINARGRDLDADPFASVEELRDYAESTAATLMRVAVWMLAPDAELSEGAEAAIRHAGIAWGAAGAARAFAHSAAEGRFSLPMDAAELTGVRAEEVTGGRNAEAARAALAPVLALAREEQALARRSYGEIPLECAPACLYAALTPSYLDRLEAQSDPYRPVSEPPRLLRKSRLVAASATGRI